MSKLPGLVRAALKTTLAAVLATAAVPVAASAGPAVTSFYVAPNGRDSNPGTRSAPFQTLERARDHVRAVKGRGDIDVVLAGGTYQLTRTFELTSADSAAAGRRITYRAAPGARPTISGGKQVTGWSLADPARNIYKAHIGSVDTRQFYVNGELQQRARDRDNPPGFAKTATGYSITDTSLQNLRNQSAVEVNSLWGWMHYRCPVQSISATAMTMQQQCWHNANLHTGVEIQTPNWLENAYEFLDTPGEWYLDKTTGDLYYLPKAGQDLSTAVVPVVQDLVNFNGDVNNPVRGIGFDGITFSYSTWLAPSSADGMVEGQAAFRIVGANNPNFDSTRFKWVKTPGAVNTNYGHDLSFTGNTFTHLGAVGLNLNLGTQRTRITGNVFRQIAGTGIQVGGADVVDAHPADLRSTTKDNTVSNNVVTGVADQYWGSLGIFVGYTDHTVVTHNKVYNLPYSGISVGWGWGMLDKGGDTNSPGNNGVPVWDVPTIARNNVVSDNRIFGFMKRLSDGGAVYTLSSNPGSTVSGNFISGVPAPAYGAIYHDEASQYFHTTQNAFCDVAFQWMLLNHGLDITADRNFTTQPKYSAQANTLRTTIANNPTVDGCQQLPAGIVNHAGLEPQYRHLDPDPVSSDRSAPSVPGAPTAVTAFPTVADLSWPAATDNVGVTGYSVFQDGELVGASKNPQARIAGLVPGRKYDFTVTARDAAANESRASRRVSVTMPSGPNLALRKPVTVSSFSGSNTPELAVDGNLSSRWAQGLGLPDPSWIQVDLGAQHNISGIITTFELTRYRYRLEVSTDQNNWVTFEDHTAADTTVSANYSAVPNPVAARYVRLTVTGSNWNGGSIYELEVYGTPLPGGTDTQAPTLSGKPAANVLLPSTLDLSWPAATDNAGIAGYTVTQDGRQIATTAQPSLRVSGLKPASAYTFAVTARDAAGNVSSPIQLTLTTPADVSLALRKPVTVSSFSAPNTPELAVDGDLGTRWAQGLGLPDPSWIQVDLGSVTALKSTVINFELTNGYRYRLETSTDGTSWSMFDDHTAVPTTERTNHAFAAAPVQARYLRLTVTGSNWNGGSVYEIQAYGGF
ncbi:discoidin domain-containing protein [Lentzea sp. NPDC051213]|uniref:discoidin domain-containing protein n=1 Tax=Lentzea sp. NPDC051213 TaxID=3364126 RepID=UPI0037AE11CA